MHMIQIRRGSGDLESRKWLFLSENEGTQSLFETARLTYYLFALPDIKRFLLNLCQ
jgi:hypothetical protein